MNSNLWKKFWSQYLDRRKDYRDDAWEHILNNEFKHLPPTEQRLLLDDAMNRVITKTDEWDLLLHAIVSPFASSDQMKLIQGKVSDLLPEAITDDDTRIYAANLVVALLHGNLPGSIGIATDYLEKLPIGSSWRYIAKTLYSHDSTLFCSAVNREIVELGKLEFDFSTFIRIDKTVQRALKLYFGQDSQQWHYVKSSLKLD